MKILIISIHMIWFLPVSVYTQNSEAIIFDRFDGSLIILPEEIAADQKCGAWAVACPAETPAELDFISKYSVTRNAVFVRQIHSRDSEASEVKKNVCKEPHKIALSYKVSNFTFQFGYEVYYELKYAEFFHRYNVLGKYRKIEEAIKALKNRFTTGIYLAKEYYRVVKKSLNVGETELWMNRDRKMGFGWLYFFKLRFDLSKKILTLVWYQIEENNKWTIGVQCEDYSLGSEVYEGIDVDELYRNQARLFVNLKLPKDACESTDLEQVNDGAQPNNNKCLIKWSLIPIDNFRFGYKTPPICSNMLTIAIWKNKVESVMKKVDAYLFTLYRVIKEPLLIITGTYGEVEFSKKRSWKKSTLYLEPNAMKIPVPKIIFKIVEYKLVGCQQKEKYCTYSGIIIIHNDPSFKLKDKICNDVTSKWQWDEIKIDYDDKQSDIVYLCENSTSVQEKLKMGTSEEVMGGLNLKEFPFLNLKNMDLEVYDIKDKMNRTFKQFRQNGDISDVESNRIALRKLIESSIDSSDFQQAVKEEEKEGSAERKEL